PRRPVPARAEVARLEASRLLHAPQGNDRELGPKLVARLAGRERIPQVEPADVHRSGLLLLRVKIGVRRQVREEGHRRSASVSPLTKGNGHKKHKKSQKKKKRKLKEGRVLTFCSISHAFVLFVFFVAIAFFC